MFNKKALTHTALLASVLTVILLFVLYSFSDVLFSYADNNVDEDACKASIINSAILNEPIFRLAGGFQHDVVCTMGTRTITSSDLKTKDGIEAKGAKDKIGNAICDCNARFLNGKQLLFEEGTEVYCSICYKIEFEKKGEEINGLGTYLLSHPTYAKCLTGYENTDSGLDSIKADIASNPNFNKISTDDDYLVTFNLFTEDYLSKLEATTGGGAIGLVAGAVLGLVGAIAIVGTGGLAAFVIIPAATVGGGALGLAGGAYAGNQIGNAEDAGWKSGVAFVNAEEGVLKELGCTYLK